MIHLYNENGTAQYIHTNSLHRDSILNFSTADAQACMTSAINDIHNSAFFGSSKLVKLPTTHCDQGWFRWSRVVIERQVGGIVSTVSVLEYMEQVVVSRTVVLQNQVTTIGHLLGDYLQTSQTWANAGVVLL